MNEKSHKQNGFQLIFSCWGEVDFAFSYVNHGAWRSRLYQWQGGPRICVPAYSLAYTQRSYEWYFVGILYYTSVSG